MKQTIAEFLNEASSILEVAGVPEPRREAGSLLSLALEQDKTFLFAHPEYELTSTETKRYSEYVRRRKSREPFQHISGVQEFYGLEFEVSPDVLIPRPETEMVVGRAIEILQNKKQAMFCEVGVGSGCVAISILANVQNAIGIGLDVSARAIEVAERNAEKHSLRERTTLRESDIFSRLEETDFDLIVSNPPYVPAYEVDGLEAEVRNFEPHIALIGGDDGLSIVRRIIGDSPRFLKSQGVLLLEIGMGQSDAVTQMFGSGIWKSVDITADFQGIPRLACARLK